MDTSWYQSEFANQRSGLLEGDTGLAHSSWDFSQLPRGSHHGPVRGAGCRTSVLWCNPGSGKKGHSSYSLRAPRCWPRLHLDMCRGPTSAGRCPLCFCSHWVIIRPTVAYSGLPLLDQGQADSCLSIRAFPGPVCLIEATSPWYSCVWHRVCAQSTFIEHIPFS